MTKVLKFKIEIEGLEDKLWRIVEITDKRTAASLAYTILASFESLAYHLYNIQYKDKIYDCWVCIEDDHSEVPPINATTTKLSELNLKENDTMVMEYDYGTPTTFKITYLGSREFEKYNGMHYPRVIDGAGSGMIDDLTNEELKEIINTIDKKGESNFYAFRPDRRNKRIYDYRKFNVEKNNLQIKRYYTKIKDGYELPEYYY